MGTRDIVHLRTQDSLAARATRYRHDLTERLTREMGGRPTRLWRYSCSGDVELMFVLLLAYTWRRDCIITFPRFILNVLLVCLALPSLRYALCYMVRVVIICAKSNRCAREGTPFLE